MTITFEEYKNHKDTLRLVTGNFLQRLLKNTDNQSKLIIQHLIDLNNNPTYIDFLECEADYRLQEAGIEEPTLEQVKALAESYADVCIVDMDTTLDMAKDFIEINNIQ